MFCHSCFKDRPEEEFPKKKPTKRKQESYPSCSECMGFIHREWNRVMYVPKKKLEDDDYEGMVERWAKKVARESYKGWTEGDLRDVQIARRRGVLKGELHIYLGIPRYRITKMIKAGLV